MARPRTVQDETLIRAAYELVMSEGPRGLTFEKLGERVGLVPAALVRRFANKRQLLIKVDQYALARSNKKLQEAMARHDSPIDAILAGFVTELSFATTIERFVHGQEYLLMDLGDKDLYANYHQSFHDRYRTVQELLKRAQDRGELSKDVDLEELAQFLQMILHGAGHVWAMDQKEPIENYIHKYVQMALRPYTENNKRETKENT